jgi:Response regulator containing CheY-like receiver domain and AraC-type DNA-binding domain
MYRLLIVDDEQKIRNGLRIGYAWDKLGFTVAGEASNGLEALDFIAVNTVDVILADIRMPLLSGIDFITRLREQNNPVKVVFLSGFREFEYARKAIQYGVYEYLVKPTRYDEVVSTFTRIREALDRENRILPDPANEERLEEGFYDKIIHAVCSYIENDISEASLEGAAATVGRSVYYLSRLFKQCMGQNFSEYVMSKKMERAASLLANYHYGINDISNLLGYDSPKNFSKAFKIHYGKSPREYRYNLENGRECKYHQVNTKENDGIKDDSKEDPV